MKRYTVMEVARLAGVSVRTLHHYDDLGLLKPAEVGANGYRYYGREELLRLQQILLHRELELPLQAIAAVLEAPDFDRVAALKAHRKVLAERSARYRRLLRTVDATLAELQGATDMDDKDLYQGFAPEKQAEHEAWLVDRYGDDMQARINQVKGHMKTWSKQDWEAFTGEGKAISAAAGKALADGLPAESEAVSEIMRRHYAWTAKAWGARPSPESFVGLGRLYVENPDFTASYDKVRPGLAEYMAAAMKAYVERAEV
jgi:MerR family transcriptional regulator, thiopeptide resistance regulator